MTTERPRTVVEFVDTTPHDTGHAAKHVRINGTEVLVESGTIDLTFSDNEVTKITLTLLPTEVHFIHEEPLIAAEERPQFEVGDWVRISDDAKYTTAVRKVPVDPQYRGKSAIIRDAAPDSWGDVLLKVEGLPEYLVHPDYIERVEDPRPLQVGDTVRVPKGATFAHKGERLPNQHFETEERTMEVWNPEGNEGNLVLNHPGEQGGYVVHPDQVTRVES